MISVYEASSGLDAHMILHLLEQQHISGRIEGEYLQGGIGELQAMGFVRVQVAEEDHARAKQIISEWEAVQPSEVASQKTPSGANGIGTFLAGITIGAAVMYWLMKLTGT